MSVNKNWTPKEAQAANDAALHENPERNPNDPTLPLFQWHGLNYLDQLHEQFKQGSKFALMQALRECARCGLVMPEWVATNYIKAHDTILNYRSKDWNEVLCSPIPKGANLNALRKKRALQFGVLNEARDILSRSPERAIDAGLFEEVGNKFHIGKTLAEEYCRSAEKITGFPLRETKLQTVRKKQKNPTKF
ncbi:MAG: hypothetical protein H6937_12760 [Burkholderiales bacterium]|nr:hypothetical protein [Burkholderiales bacterium]MCP5251563.1 hypothetical protein [Burkholderiales bacterium]